MPDIRKDMLNNGGNAIAPSRREARATLPFGNANDPRRRAHFADQADRSGALTKRYYQLFALALLIGAPLLVSMLSSLIPGIHPLGPPEAHASVRPDYVQPAANPAANLPPAMPNPPPVSQNGQAGQQTSEAGTTINTTGMSVAGVDPSASAAAVNPSAPVGSAEPTAGGISPDFDDGTTLGPADSEDGKIQRLSGRRY